MTYRTTEASAVAEIMAMIENLRSLILTDTLQDFATASEHYAMVRAYEALIVAKKGLETRA